MSRQADIILRIPSPLNRQPTRKEALFLSMMRGPTKNTPTFRSPKPNHMAHRALKAHTSTGGSTKQPAADRDLIVDSRRAIVGHPSDFLWCSLRGRRVVKR